MPVRLAFRRILALLVEQRHAAKAAGRLCPLKILVATAEPVARRQLSAAVRRLGHSATVVGDGPRAVALCRAHRFDLVLVDVPSLGLDGLVATRAIRAGGGPNETIAIAALIAHLSAERQRFFDRAGLNHFMAKPIDQAQLADLLAGLAEQRVVVRACSAERTERAN